MAKIKLAKEMLEKINSIKEVLSTMPVNNEKNKEKYLKKIVELQDEYIKYEKKLEKELNSRYEELSNFEKSNDIELLNGRLATIENVLCLLENKKTSYQKMGLDKSIYRIGKFYKENLENVNIQIYKCLQKFEKVGVYLSAKDFDYSIYATKYMEVFFSEIENNKIHSEKLKAKFEEIYWKCPDIILHIELNIRSIYLNKQQIIDKYFEKEKQELIKKWDKEPGEICKTYLELKKQKLEKEAIDKKTIMEKFQNGLKPQEYEANKIEQKCQEIMEINNEKDIKENTFKFLNSLYEYKGAMRFSFIVKDIKEIYDKKENNKKIYTETKKKIEALEKKMKKNSKQTGLFKKKNPLQEKIVEQNNMILELKQMYRQLEQYEFALKVEESLNETSTLEDVLTLANSNYCYMAICQIKNIDNITQEQIEETMTDLTEFLSNPYHTIINNMPFTQEKDMAIIIKDRYKLMNFKIEKEDISPENVDNIIAILEQIELAFNIQEAGIKIDELEELEMLKKCLKR